MKDHEEFDGCSCGCSSFLINLAIYAAVLFIGYYWGESDEAKVSNDIMRIILVDEQKREELKSIFDNGQNARFDFIEKKFIATTDIGYDKFELWKLKSKDLDLQKVEVENEI